MNYISIIFHGFQIPTIQFIPKNMSLQKKILLFVPENRMVLKNKIFMLRFSNFKIQCIHSCDVFLSKQQKMHTQHNRWNKADYRHSLFNEN